MPNSPKTTMEKVEKITNAWRTLALDKTFAGLTLAQFEAATAPSREARRRIEDLNNQLTQAITDRDTADDTSDARVQQVVAGVLADPTEGPDSALYEAFGYTRKSERKPAGRKRNPPPQE